MNYNVKGEGVLLTFEPVYSKGENISHFIIRLVNDSSRDYLFNFELHMEDRMVESQKGRIDSATALPLGELRLENLNDKVAVKVECWPEEKVAGKLNHLSKEIKLRPNSFFNKLRQVPLTGRECYTYELFDELPELRRKDPSIDPKLKPAPRRASLESHEIYKKASFKNEIDLHIQLLINDHAKLTAHQIVEIQLRAFEKFLYDAIDHNASRIYVIHGLGKGSLKERIWDILEETAEVGTYHDSYHPKYGHGATEVNFQG
ncbi:MAG: Smr/MutS family protein, partial [Bacteroidetes bacterium]|nr:Smr/MutS family protein [Bacteroidota bacterium]